MSMWKTIRRSTLAAVAALLAAGCATEPKSEQVMVVFPPPPARPRMQYLTFANGADEVEPEKGSFETFILGEDPTAVRTLNKPYGIAARDGVVYVCDTKGLSIARLDYKNQKFSIFGVQGPGRVRKPINIAIDSLGYKFVVDSVRKQVLVYDPGDQYVTAFAIPKPCHPVDVAVYGDELFVLDNDATCQIVVLDRRTGDVLRTIGEPGGEPGQFKIPNSLAISDDGFIYVSDTHNWRIQKLTLDGKSVWAKGKPGYTIGQFGRPRGIRTGPDGTVYVVDGATEIVQMFDPDGNTLMRFGGPGNSPGSLGLPASVAIDATSIPYFKQFIHPKFNAEYLVFVVSQYGTRLVSVYAFGAFPDGFALSELNIAPLPAASMDKGIGPAESEPSDQPESEAPDDPTHREKPD